MKTIPLEVFEICECTPHIDDQHPYQESATCIFFTIHNSAIIGRFRRNVLGVNEIWTGCSTMAIQPKHVHSWAYLDDVMLEVGK